VTTTCKTCRFFLDHGPGYDNVCRRYPPLPMATTRHGFAGEYAAVESKYPQVSCDDWCGEHEPAVTP
jgi:hypothetical protein